jgi:hypothetical protein
MRSILLVALVAILFGSCDQIDKLTQFKLDYTTEATIPGTAGLNIPIVLSTPDRTTNSEQEFAVNDTRKDLIEEIYLDEVTLTLKSPTGEDFSFLNDITIYINADGLPEKELATKDPVPTSTGNTLTLDVSRVDAQEYIKKAAFSLRVEATVDEVIQQDHTFDIYTKFFVDAKILGV